MLIHRTYQLRGYTSAAGYARIYEVLGSCQRLYNQALAERIAVYRLTGKSITRFNQFKWLTDLRSNSQQLSDMAVAIHRGALTRLDRAFQAFFRRVKAGEKPGFPRFKPWQRYTCIELAGVSPYMVKGNRIKVKGLPSIRMRPSRQLPDSSQLKALRLVMHGRKLTCDLVYEEQAQPLPYLDKGVGIDMGINERMTLSDGSTVERRVVDHKRERRLQRVISRRKKGSNGRRKAVAAFAREKRRNVVRNCNACHHITTDIVKRFGWIVVEDLKIGNMTAAGGSWKKGLNREILAQGWGILRQQLAYKAEWAGRQFSAVNPAYTSRTCSVCGEVQPEAKAYRLFKCLDCGHMEDRDVNAAKVIKARGDFAPVAQPSGY